MKRLILGAGVLFAGCGLAHGQMEAHTHKAGVPSTTLTVAVAGKTVTLTAAALAAMPQRRIVAHNGHSNVDETYMGVAVSDLLAKEGVALAGDGAKKIYQSYLRAEGTDHYFVLYSCSEVEGDMHAGEVIVALTLDGKPLTEDGAFKLVSTEDKRPARWVRNLTALTLVGVE
jgi:hypothetical protein